MWTQYWRQIDKDIKSEDSFDNYFSDSGDKTIASIQDSELEVHLGEHSHNIQESAAKAHAATCLWHNAHQDTERLQ